MTLLNKLVVILLVGIIGLFAIRVNAGGYAGIMGTYVDGPQTNHTAVQALGGYKFNDILSVEGRWLFSASEEGYRGSDVEIDSLYGGYFVISLPLFDEFEPYAVVGHSRGELVSQDSKYSKKPQSTSIGFGVKYLLLEAWTVRAEYTSLFNDVDTFAVGINLNF